MSKTTDARINWYEGHGNWNGWCNASRPTREQAAPPQDEEDARSVASLPPSDNATPTALRMPLHARASGFATTNGTQLPLKW